MKGLLPAIFFLSGTVGAAVGVDAAIGVVQFRANASLLRAIAPAHCAPHAASELARNAALLSPSITTRPEEG